MTGEPDMSHRIPTLPKGCKDLIDALKRKKPQQPQKQKVAGLSPLSTEHVFVNGKIRAPKVAVFEPSGTALGVFYIFDALAMAKDRGVDLVLFNARVTPPECVLIDYGKYRYQQSKQKRKGAG
jgi:translation initiation factor IF-3-like protein